MFNYLFREKMIIVHNSIFNDGNVDKIIDSVISGINPNWPTIYKIRYIYLEIGKKLYRDTDFFFSVDGKLGKDNLSLSEIKNIYNSKTGRDLRVICKSASYILKKAYEEVGINSELVETNTTIAALNDEEEFLINHWFLAIHDDNDVYFATLTPDLPYIQLNMETRHFASDIPYKRNYNGKVMQIYKGNEIKHSVISRKRLKEIDISIGYIKNYYNYNDSEWSLGYDDVSLYILKENLRNNKLFYELEKYQTSFYKDLIEFEGDNHKKISLTYDKVSKLTDNDWNLWIKIMCKHVLGKIEEILGYNLYILPDLENVYWNYESWLLNLCVQIQSDLFKIFNNGKTETFNDIKIDVHDFKYNKWSRKVKKKFCCDNMDDDYNNVLAILDKTNALVNCINNKGNNGNFSELFSSLTYHFIDPKHLFESNIGSDGYLSNYYIANKFDKLFRKIFSCNEGINDFNRMGYSEQVVIIKEILNLMFPEINRSNSIKLSVYNDNYNAVLNRIQLYPIKSKENGEYSILFNILGDNNKYGDYYFFYSPKDNVFRISNALDIYNDYIIVSNRMKNRMSINDLEEIDELNSRAIKK